MVPTKQVPGLTSRGGFRMILRALCSIRSLQPTVVCFVLFADMTVVVGVLTIRAVTFKVWHGSWVERCLEWDNPSLYHLLYWANHWSSMRQVSKLSPFTCRPNPMSCRGLTSTWHCCGSLDTLYNCCATSVVFLSSFNPKQVSQNRPSRTHGVRSVCRLQWNQTQSHFSTATEIERTKVMQAEQSRISL